jgi:hypothetical protein
MKKNVGIVIAATVALLLGAHGVTSASRPLQAQLQLAQFNAIESLNSGHVVLRPGSTQRVTMVKGSLDYTRVAVTDRGVLVIQKCDRKCPRGYELELEILVPNISRISLSNGGRIQSLGAFPRQGELSLAVSNGGMVDVRSIVADRITATVEQGGRILTVPQSTLLARVSHGGAITYWGSGQVTSSIEDGGIVSKGSARELVLPLSDIGKAVQAPHRRKH